MSSNFKPFITIITVVKDDKEGLTKTAKSILSQSDKEFEWLVVDGYSKDGSIDFLKTLRTEIEINTFQIPPKGIYNAMNFAANNSKGDWLWFINAGDILLTSQALSEMKIYILKNKNQCLISTPVAYLTKSQYLFDIAVNRVESVSEYKIAIMNHQGVCVTKEVFFEVNGFDEKLKYAADGKFLDSVVLDRVPIIGNKLLVGFEMGGTSSKNFRKTLQEMSSYRPKNKSEKLSRSKILLFNWVRELISLIDENRYSSALPGFKLFLNVRERKILHKFQNNSRNDIPEGWREN